jgi:hypothetical protein
VIRELNAAMTWPTYPGRATGTAAAEEVDFVDAVRPSPAA